METLRVQDRGIFVYVVLAAGVADENAVEYPAVRTKSLLWPPLDRNSRAGTVGSAQNKAQSC